MRKVIVQCSLFAHSEKKIYTAEEAAEIALQCQQKGAVMVHAHIYKLGTVEEFMKMAYILEEKNGPFLNLSVSDFGQVVSWKGRKSKLICSAAMHGADCNVFGNSIAQPYDKAVEEMEMYLKAGLVPEVSIFNLEGAENCAKLNEIYPKKFFTGIYLGYPGELEATRANIRKLLNILKDCRFNSFVIYNNQDDDLVRFIIENGGEIRCGMEDSQYCGNKAASDSIEIVCHMVDLVKECGLEVSGTI